ncbi:GGDEF domain-containing protein [Candidatus Wolfebacteria bacterium]|nr:GGDEF domain-containing protein [Candidatus Wolfebacteria bacterium]
MKETTHTIKELKAEVERLRSFVTDIHELSAELVDGKEASHDEVAEKIRVEMERLRGLVFTDELTRVMNRRGFYERFEGIFREAVFFKTHPETKRSLKIIDFAIVFIDLDDFKQVNDTYGHDEGDRVLKATAEFLQSQVRDIDGAARFGGEEFILALVGANEDQAYEKGQEALSALRERVTLSRAPDKAVTASIGVAALRASDADNLDELVGYADKAMYEAKTARGKNAVVRYSEL